MSRPRILRLAAMAALLGAAATPAHAGGVLLFLTAGFGGVGALSLASIGTWLTSNVWGRIVGSLIISSLQARLARRKQGPAPGLRTNVAGTGGLNPRTFGMGTYATKGTRAAPDNTATAAGVENYWWVQVHDLSDVAGAKWLRCAIEGEWVTDAMTAPAGWTEDTLDSKFYGNSFIILRTGAEATADAWLLANFGADPSFPWTSDMKGTGIVQAIMGFAYKPTIYNGVPDPVHELQGLRLYDWRTDTTAFSENVVVEIYHAMRGIDLASLGTWGGKIPAIDLPSATWTAAANICDVAVPRLAGGTEPRFRAGLEIKVTDQPHEVLAQLLDACNGEMAECAGVWKIRVGAPGLPVYFFSDADTLITLPEDLDPFPASEAIINAIRPVYTSPAMFYQPVEGPLITNAAWELEDGEQKVAELPLPAVTSDGQAQRLAAAELNAQRRWRTHRVPLPPDAMVLEPLDVVAWTSPRNGYVAKQFEVTEVEDQAETMIIVVSLREIEPDDYVWDPADEQPVSAAPPPKPVVPPQVLTGIGLAVTVHTTGAARRRALTVTWPGTELVGKGLEYEIRRVGDTALLCSGAVLDATLGTATAAAEPLPGVSYETRVRLTSISPQAWSAWASVAVPARRTVGSPTLTALGSSMTVTNAMTAFTAVATVSATDAAFSGQEASFAKLQCSLSGATSAKLVWRQIARQTPSGGSYVIFERIEELTSGRTLILSGGGSVAAPWTAFDVTTEVSGELLPGGATVTITHHANQFITPHS